MSLPRRGLANLFAASVSATSSFLPVPVLGVLAPMMLRDLSLTEAHLGALTSIFFAVSAIAVVPGGRLSERLGAHRTMRLAMATNGTALLGAAVSATSFAALGGWLVVAGVANGISQPATNLAIAQGFPQRRQGLAMGVKQAAIPVGAMLAGVSVPVVALDAGWRFTMGLFGLTILGMTVGISRKDVDANLETGREAALDTSWSGRRTLLPLAVALGFGTFAANSLTAFYVQSAVVRGLDAGTAASWLAVGAGCAIVGRIWWGWWADWKASSPLSLVSALLLAGAVGVTVVSLSQSAIGLASGTPLAFGAGWAWSGLLLFAVVNAYPAVPGTATGFVMTGAFVGGTTGPYVFGVVAERVSYRAAWNMVALSLLMAALIVRQKRLGVE